jgi:hypothetical protein
VKKSSKIAREISLNRDRVAGLGSLSVIFDVISYVKSIGIYLDTIDHHSWPQPREIWSHPPLPVAFSAFPAIGSEQDKKEVDLPMIHPCFDLIFDQ